MHCPYCRSINNREAERCMRCGRRLATGSANAYPTQGSAAQMPVQVIAFESRAHHAADSAADWVEDGEEEAIAPKQRGWAASAGASETAPQQALFGERESSGWGDNVVPIPTLTPHQPNSTESKRSRAKRRTTARPPVRLPDPQQNLQFVAALPELRQRPEERIVCNAPVAVPVHRLMAAGFDGAIILLGVVVVSGIFFGLVGSELPLRAALLTVGGMWLTVAALYKALWCLADADTPGMRAAGLRVVDFDGRVPQRKARVVRAVTGMLSIASAGLGVLWSLVDEEQLSWHDHISKTFPTSG